MNKFLDHNTVKSNLILSSLYLSAYELLKASIIDNIRDFFSFEYINDKAIPVQQYKDEITRVDSDLLRASCLWLQRNGIITETDVDEIRNIRSHRNQIAHELPRLLIDSDLDVSTEYLMRVREILETIEIWWVKNVGIPADSDFDGIEVDEKDILPGRVIILDHIISIAFTDDQKQHDGN